MFVRLFIITVVDNKKYKDNLNNLVYSTIEGESAPRGRIYDRNHKLLVDNVGIKSIYYKRKSGMSIDDEIEVAKKLSEVLDLDYENVTSSMIKDFYLVLNRNITYNKIT